MASEMQAAHDAADLFFEKKNPDKIPLVKKKWSDTGSDLEAKKKNKKKKNKMADVSRSPVRTTRSEWKCADRQDKMRRSKHVNKIVH